MRVAILGASGFVGRRLTTALRTRGDDVASLSLRDPAAAAAACAGYDVVVNLAGESIAQRWNEKVKERLRASRVDAPRALIAALGTLTAKPSVYVSASAVGYYGTSETLTFVETSAAGDDFLARVCVDWEAEARVAERHGMRVAIVRTGIVLGAEGGAVAKMLPIFKAGAGGPIGSGKQWYSWIHADDLVAVYLAAIDGTSGVLNATAPSPVTNAAFMAAFGRALARPAIVPVPDFALKMLLGEGADVVTHGQRVLPERTLAEGVNFAYPTIEAALAQVVAAA